MSLKRKIEKFQEQLVKDRALTAERDLKKKSKGKEIAVNDPIDPVNGDYLMSYLKSKQMAMGGSTQVNSYEDKVVNHFEEGGSHEANPFGGIPYGQGKSVEEDEMSYNLKGGKFIFSNRIKYA
jgi:hypothetical protein